VVYFFLILSSPSDKIHIYSFWKVCVNYVDCAFQVNIYELMEMNLTRSTGVVKCTELINHSLTDPHPRSVALYFSFHTSTSVSAAQQRKQICVLRSYARNILLSSSLFTCTHENRMKPLNRLLDKIKSYRLLKTTLHTVTTGFWIKVFSSYLLTGIEKTFKYQRCKMFKQEMLYLYHNSGKWQVAVASVTVLL
jgi:hypothetical protein